MEVEFGQGFGLNALPRMPGRKIRKTHIGKIESLLSTLCRVLNLNFQIKKGAGERKVEWSLIWPPESPDNPQRAVKTLRKKIAVLTFSRVKLPRL